MLDSGQQGTRTDSGVLAAPQAARRATSSPSRRLAPLSVSRALRGWSRGLLGMGLFLLLAMLAGLLVVFLVYTWTVDLMIVLASLPVALAIALVFVWFMRRALVSVAGSFVNSITSTPLVAIEPPPRPATLASPLAVVRAIGLLPVMLLVVLLVCVVAGVDVWVATTGDVALRVGALAVSCDGLAGLAVLVLTLGGMVGGLGRTIAARESEVGARFYVLAMPPSQEGQGGAQIAVCAVPEPV